MPGAAASLSIGYLASIAAPALLPVVVVAAALAGCALVLVRRPTAALRLVLSSLVVWLAVGLGGAFLLRSRPLVGLAWVVLFLYAAPLPVIAWLYARTFPGDAGPTPTLKSGSPVDGRGTAP